MKSNKKTTKKTAVKALPVKVQPKLAAAPKAPEPIRIHEDDLMLFGKVTRPLQSDGDTVYPGGPDEIPGQVIRAEGERGWRYYPHIETKGGGVINSFEFASKELARDALEAEIQLRLSRAVRQAGGRVTWAASTV